MKLIDELREAALEDENVGLTHTMVPCKTVLALCDAAEALSAAEKLDAAGWLMHPGIVARARAALARLAALEQKP